jgi:hypothetical protein
MFAQSLELRARIDAFELRVLLAEISHKGIASFPAKLTVVIMLMFA